MPPRSGWSDTTAAYRARLIGSAKSGKLTGTKVTGTKAEVEAQTRAYWESGGSLSRGRGHANPNYVSRPSTAAPKKATARESVGMGDAKTYDQLERWRSKPSSRGGPPGWIPRDPQLLGTDVAAILSQLDISPSKWKSVTFNWGAGEGAVVVTITPKRGRDRSVILPDAQAAEQFGRLLKSPALMATSEAERKRLLKEWGRPEGQGIEVENPGRSPGYEVAA